MDTLPKKGQKIRVKKGAAIGSTYPKLRRIATRSFTVVVHHIIEYSVKHHNRPSEITWAGSGGYWCWVSSQDCEVLDG